MQVRDFVANRWMVVAPLALHRRCAHRLAHAAAHLARLRHGSNGDPAAGLGLLLFYLPAALVGTAAGCGIVYRVLAPRSLGFALAVSAAAMVLIVWAILVWGSR
ncbi:hypothetical protein GCM10009624_35260 [Gordonia sinesedis]